MRILPVLLSTAAFALAAVSSANAHTAADTAEMQKDYLASRRAMMSTPAAQSAIINNKDINGERISLAVTLAALSQTAKKYGNSRVIEWNNQGYGDGNGHGALAPALATAQVKLIDVHGKTDHEIMGDALKQVSKRVVGFLGEASARVLAALNESNATYQPFATCLRNQWGKMADKCGDLFNAVVGRHSQGDRPKPSGLKL